MTEARPTAARAIGLRAFARMNPEEVAVADFSSTLTPSSVESFDTIITPAWSFLEYI
jgi:hypothetical protein